MIRAGTTWGGRTAACLPLVALLAGCALGPDYKKPAPPTVSNYTAQPLAPTAAAPDVAGGEAQRFASGADIPADWWTLYHSPALNGLIEQALANNHDLKAAQAALKAAREGTRAQRGAFLPSVSAGLSAVRSKTSGDISNTPANDTALYNLFTPQVSVAYAPDVFGLTRRTVESAQAQEQGVRYQMIAAYLTLTSNVAAAAIQQASLQTQVDATRELIAINGKIVETLKYQQSKGYANGLDLAAQQALAAQTAAALPPLLTQLAQQKNLLAVLTGQFPSQAAPVNLDLASLTLPQDLPLSLPSALVAQRPDVLQAEANLHSASALVGVAQANRLPNLQLTADAGNSAVTLHRAFGPGTGFWDLGAAVTAPIFQGGALMHQARAAKANYVQAAEQYRGTVLTAFQNVADTLSALQNDAEALKATAAAADAAKVGLDLSERQWRAGYASYLVLLNAQQAYQQARIALVQAQAARFADTAALFQALGGGWWRRADLAKDKHAD